MNDGEIKYLRNYLRDKVNTGERMNYKVYSVEYNNLMFNFEAVGIYTTSLICDKYSMSYRFEDSLATCCCRVQDCVHKKELNNLLNSILDGKDL